MRAVPARSRAHWCSIAHRFEQADRPGRRSLSTRRTATPTAPRTSIGSDCYAAAVRFARVLVLALVAP
ncbi:MAG: hypothetical protein M3680_36120, partial [Myxococcota bacterium]|nr:hypothetical protein [Myxococcota bacterium]